MGMKTNPAQVTDIRPIDNDEAAQQLRGELQKRPKKLAEVLVEKGLVAPGALADPDTETSFRLDPSLFLDTGILELIPRSVAYKHSVLPLAQTSTELFLAAKAFPPRKAIEELKRISGLEPQLLFVDEDDLSTAIELCYSRVRQLGFQQMRLGEILVARGLITREQLEQTLERQ